MAIYAPGFDRLVLELGLAQWVIVAVQAQGLAGFLDQELVRGSVRHVAVQAAGLDRLLLELGLAEWIIVAVQAECLAGFLDQELIRG